MAESYTLTQSDLFQAGRIVIAPPSAEQPLFARAALLAQAFATRQGVAENPPFVTRRMCEEFPGRYHLGAGVFVLTAREILELNLSIAERALLRPYFETSAIRRYWVSPEPTHGLLYLTKATCPTLEPFPNVNAHLARFREILERRREVQHGKCGWWHLHWPREEGIFLHPKAFSVQMGKRPQFAFCERPAFVGFSVNLLLPNAEPGMPLAALTGILNSNLAFRWFERHAKRRGVNLEINAHVLQEFPLPARDEILEEQLAQLVLARQSAPAGSLLTKREDAEIEALVVRLYEQDRARSHLDGAR